MVADLRHYEGREQAYVKHYFLEKYLDALIHKTASSYNEIAYVDGFSGPWQSKNEDYADTSFGIALTALRKAKASWKAQGRDVKMCAHLVEQSPVAYKDLEAIKAKYPDIAIHTYNQDFATAASSIVASLPKQAFTFCFIDPKGWKIDISQLGPLLSRQNSEVLFNFMFDFINRAASMKDPLLVDALSKLMPHGDWQAKLEKGSNAAERKKILADAFRETLKKIGGYEYVAEVPVLRPLKDRTLYSLFYGTRHSKGMEVFRGCHIKTEKTQADVRDKTKHEHKVKTTQQTELFDHFVETGPNELESFLQAEKIAAEQTLIGLVPHTPQSVLYGIAWPRVLEKHVVTRSNVNKIAGRLKKEGTLVFPTWAERKLVPDDGYSCYKALISQV